LAVLQLSAVLSPSVDPFNVSLPPPPFHALPGNSGDNASDRLEQQHRRMTALPKVSDIAFVDGLDALVVDLVP
jgi:hypothetical protein